MTQQEKRGRGAPLKGNEPRRNATRSFSPTLLQALQDVARGEQSDFIEAWMWKHPKLIEWLEHQQ